MHYEPLQPFGVELSAGISYWQDFPAKLRELIEENSVVLIRNEKIEGNELEEMASLLGSLLAWDFGVVNELKIKKDAKNYLYSHHPVPFHWDGAFFEEPAILLFHCINSDGGETLFTDTTKIFQEASVSQQKIWESVTLIYETEKIVHYGGRIRGPMVRQHPNKSTPILRYAEPVDTSLNPVSCELESEFTTLDSLQNEMHALLYDPRFCYRHAWQSGDILLADNLTLLHARTALPPNSARHIRRIQLL